MKNVTFAIAFSLLVAFVSHAQAQNSESKKWGAEVNLLWPIYPGNIYKAQVTYETWRKNDLAGDVFVGIHIRPFEYRKEEGDFANYALTFGYRQFLWKGLHLELYNAFGPGYNRNNAIDGKDYTSWDYEVGLLGGYRWEFLKKEKREQARFSPYLSTQHGVFYVASKSNPHPIIGFTSEQPIYVGTLNLGVRF